MSYKIFLECYENQERATVMIESYSDESKSARLSQLQCIGWINSIRRLVESKTHPHNIENPEYYVEALVLLAGLTEQQALTLSLRNSEKETFMYAWSVINEEERSFASSLNYEQFDNFWSGYLIPMAVNLGGNRLPADQPQR